MATGDPPGIPLADALAAFSDPAKWQEYKRLVDEGYGTPIPQIWFFEKPETEIDRLRNRCEVLQQELCSAFIAQLRSGDLIATSLNPKNPMDPLRPAIPAETWQFLEPNYEKSSASGEGFVLAGIRVSRRKGRSKRSRSSIRDAKECRAWIGGLARTLKNPPARAEIWRQAQERFGEALSEREFKRAWADAAPKKWKLPGTKSKH